MTKKQLPFVHHTYRPDIDGLRAVAIFAVIVFHALPNHLSGGFFGVDVFFVISGYLITKIIFENIKNETFSLLNFYSRRVLRIFHALILILFVSYFFGWFLLLANEYEQLGKHIAAGAAFVSNFVLNSEAGYFDNSAVYKPLLHLWSLGVEEQFYLCWPILLMIIHKYKLNLILTTIAMAIASFWFSVSNVTNEAIATFYFPHTRFWEFLIGALLVWINIEQSRAAKEPLGMQENPNHTYSIFIKLRLNIIPNGFAVLGLVLLGYGFIGLNDSIDSVGIFAFIPVIGTALLIAAGPSALINKYILSSKLLIAIGLISYPLYLWHWPLLAFARIVDGGQISVLARLTIILVSLILAWITYEVIEKPIRFGSRSKSKVFTMLWSMVFVAALGFLTYAGKGFSFRHISQINDPLITGFDGGDGNNTVAECGIADPAEKELFGKCMQDKRGNVKYALLGDSKAASLFPGLLRTSTNDGRWLIIGGTRGTAAPIPLVSSDPALHGFQKVTQIALNAISENPNIKTVVIDVSIRSLFDLNYSVQRANLISYDDKYLSGLNKTRNYDRALEGLNRALTPLIASGKKIVFVVDNPALPSPQNCIVRQTFLSNFYNFSESKKNPACIILIEDFKAQISVYTKLLGSVKNLHPESIDIFDPTAILCDLHSRSCGPTLNGRALYEYTDHISDYAAGLIGTQLNAFINGAPR